jgi:hypothetical protein
MCQYNLSLFKKFCCCISIKHFSIFSLDPVNDPMCVLLMIDFYALRSEEFEFLIRLYNEWEVRYLVLPHIPAKPIYACPNFFFFFKVLILPHPYIIGLLKLL